MLRWLRRLFWLALLTGAGYASYIAWQRKAGGTTSPDLTAEPPSWPPLTDVPDVPDATPTAAVETSPAVEASTLGGAAPVWVAPVGDACPDGFPIKVNAKSGIFHVPGGRSYDRTIPERCYPNEASAEADGYRRAKA